MNRLVLAIALLLAAPAFAQKEEPPARPVPLMELPITPPVAPCPDGKFVYPATCIPKPPAPLWPKPPRPTMPVRPPTPPSPP